MHCTKQSVDIIDMSQSQLHEEIPATKKAGSKLYGFSDEHPSGDMLPPVAWMLQPSGLLNFIANLNL